MGFCPDAATSRWLIAMCGRLSLFLTCLAFVGPANASDSVTVETLCELVGTAAQQQPTVQSAAPIELTTAKKCLLKEIMS